MQSSSTYKMLYLLYLLINGDYTKNAIVDEFNKKNLKITKPLITRYIDKFISNGFVVENIVNENRENLYHLDKKKFVMDFTFEQIKAIEDVKKLLVIQKDYNKIRKTIRLFYKIAKYIDNEELRLKFIDFGYYSTINWGLVRTLEKCCKDKDLITIDYLLPYGKNKAIELYADEIKISEWSEKIYLRCVLNGSNHFSNLPLERIFMLKKIEKKSSKCEIITDTIEYEVDFETYYKMPKDGEEKVIEETEKKVKILRKMDDEFYILQRLISFCPNLYYVSDDRIKQKLKEKLEMLRVMYDE